MSTSSLQIPWKDYHIHCLPAIDDGADSAKTSYEMLHSLVQMGVGEVVATPHFYPRQQTVEEFLSKRNQSVLKLRAYISSLEPPVIRPKLRLAAEVYLHRGLVRQDLAGLCIVGTRHLLIELPYEDYASWVFEEIWNIYKFHDIIPVFAHLERFLPRYSRDQIDELLSLPEIVVQFNDSAFADKKVIGFVKEVVAAGHPVVLGTDAHNLRSRRPSFSASANYLMGRHGDTSLLEHIMASDFLG